MEFAAYIVDIVKVWSNTFIFRASSTSEISSLDAVFLHLIVPKMKQMIRKSIMVPNMLEMRTIASLVEFSNVWEVGVDWFWDVRQRGFEKSFRWWGILLT